MRDLRIPAYSGNTTYGKRIAGYRHFGPKSRCIVFIDFNLVKESVTDPAESFPDLWLY